jgi:excinuclease UvrABC nuclease subunit
VGRKRKIDLLVALGSLETIKEASLDDLQAVPHLPKNLARTIWEHFNERVTNE